MIYDIAINNCTIIDPNKDELYISNIGIHEGVFSAITSEPLEGSQKIDAKYNMVCPGFIDVHSHIDGQVIYAAETSAKQGITTVIGGNCGISPNNIKKLFQDFEGYKNQFPMTHGVMIGHSFTLREEVGIKDRYKPAAKGQIDKMVALADKALQEGAGGISFGLEYAPGTSKEEIIALCRVAASYNRPVSVHTRYDGVRYQEGLKEMIEAAEETGVRVIISHLSYMYAYGQMEQVVSILEQARKKGIHVVADSGMYTEFVTGIGSAVFDDGFLERLNIDYSDVIIASGPYKGVRCTQNLFEKIRSSAEDNLDIGAIAMVGEKDEMLKAFDFQYTMMGTDSAVGGDERNISHPQDAGSYPKFLNTMVNKIKKMTWLEAIRRCTQLPADFFDLKDKGRIEIGADADLVIFDPDEICDTASLPTFGAVDSLPLGMRYVIGNGRIIVENGKYMANCFNGKSLIY